MENFNFDFDVDDEKSGKIFHCTIEHSVYKEMNYGADADGNRGVCKYFTEMENIIIKDEQGKIVIDSYVYDLCIDEFEIKHSDKVLSDLFENFKEMEK